MVVFLRGRMELNSPGSGDDGRPSTRRRPPQRIEPREVSRRAEGRTGGERPREEREERPPEQGPLGFLKDLWRAINEDEVLYLAASMAFFAFLAFPPTILVMLALTGFFGGEETAVWLTDRLGAMLPEEAEVFVEDFVWQIVYQEAPGPFSIGLLVALWAASNIFMAIIRSLNIAYGVEEPRSWIKQRALALGVMLLFLVFFLSGSGLLLVGPQIAETLGLWEVLGIVWGIVQWVVPFLLVVAAFWLCYYLLPARDQSGHKLEILIGAVVATALWLLATVGFRFYIANFGDYSQTYGIVGAVLIFMLWMYIASIVLLVGGELAAELERRRSR